MPEAMRGIIPSSCQALVMRLINAGSDLWSTSLIVVAIRDGKLNSGSPLHVSATELAEAVI